MPRYEIMAPGGRKFEVTAPEGVGQDEVLRRAMTQATGSSEPRVKQAPVSESPLGIAAGAVKDTLGIGRPSSEPLGRAVHQPKNLGEAAVREAIMAPVGAVAMPARIAASAASGPIAALASGKSLNEAGWAGALDAVVAGLTEGTMAGAGKLASKAGAAARGLKYSTEAPQKAYEALQSRFGKVSVVVPSLGSGKIPLEEAVKKLSTLTEGAYRQTRAEIAHIMTQLDRQRMAGGAKPYAGALFKDQTAKKRYPASTFSKVAEGVHKGADSSVARGAADVAATTPLDESGAPVGLLPALAAKDHLSFGGLARAVRHAVLP